MTPAPVLRADAMRAADQTTIDDWGVPGRVLMETAGRAAAHALLERWPRAARTTVLVGAGNNGGDGLVVARVLARRGVRVRAVVVPVDGGAGDRQANLDLLRRAASGGGPVEVVGPDEAEPSGWAPDVVVDALLGIGARGSLRGPVRSLCALADGAAPVLSLDVPSGLDATTGRAAEGTPLAAVTVTFGALKTGLLVGDGPRHAGRVVVAEVGFPKTVLEGQATAWHAPAAWAGAQLPTRAADAHKYSAGRALAVVGSRAFTGAAVLAAGAAYRAGAGAVVACVPRSAQGAVDRAWAEVMVDPQPETDAGTLAAASGDALRERARSADAVVVGCGLGRSDETDDLVRGLVRDVRAPLVLDADGLGAFAGDADRLADRDGPLVLTPHLGELRRLLGDPGYDPRDRVEATGELAARWGAVVVFKGMPSVVGLPDGRVVIGPAGEPALATAGTGDTLAGAVTGLLAQGLSPADAAVCGLHLGAAAARLWARDHGASGMVASDVVDRLPAAARSLRP